jgi:hypothetical protein
MVRSRCEPIRVAFHSLVGLYACDCRVDIMLAVSHRVLVAILLNLPLDEASVDIAFFSRISHVTTGHESTLSLHVLVFLYYLIYYRRIYDPCRDCLYRVIGGENHNRCNSKTSSTDRSSMKWNTRMIKFCIY